VAHPVGPPAAGVPSELHDELSAALAAFLDAHAGHQITHLRRDDECALQSALPLWDPMACVRMEVTDGSRYYVLTASRRSVDEPRSYRIAPGRLEIRHACVEVDDRDIRRSLDRAFYPQVLGETKVERFVRALHELLSHIEPSSLESAFDDASDPAVSVAPLPDSICSQLGQRCVEIFDAFELRRVLAFLDENRTEAGALALRIRRDSVVSPEFC
jgi:hypothetical protein